jgi:hypothetical protein
MWTVPQMADDVEELLLVQQLIEQDVVVYRPDVLRHFAEGGDYGLEDRRSQLRHVDRPVLVLSGEHDRTTAPASAHDLAQLSRTPRRPSCATPSRAPRLPLPRLGRFRGARAACRARAAAASHAR